MSKQAIMILFALSLFSDQLFAKSFFNSVKKTTSKAASATDEDVIKPTNTTVAQPTYDDVLLPTENNVLAPIGDGVDQVYKGNQASGAYDDGEDAQGDKDYRTALQDYILALAWEYDLGYAPSGAPSRDKLWDDVESCLKQNQTTEYESHGFIFPSHVKERIDDSVSAITPSRQSSARDAMYQRAGTILYDVGVHKYDYEKSKADPGSSSISDVADFIDSPVDFFMSAYELNNNVFVGGAVSQSAAAQTLYLYGMSMMNATNDDDSLKYGVSDYANYFVTAHEWNSAIVIPDKVQAYLDSSN